MSNQSLREAAQQALECKRLADNYAGACAGCDPGEFATKERDELHGAIDKLAVLAQPDDKTQPVAEVYRGHYGGRNGNVSFDGVRPLRGAKLPPPGTKLYAAPQPPAEQNYFRIQEAADKFGLDYNKLCSVVRHLGVATLHPSLEGGDQKNYLSESEFLASRLRRVAELTGVTLPKMNAEGLSSVAGTILGQIALKISKTKPPAEQADVPNYVEQPLKMQTVIEAAWRRDPHALAMALMSEPATRAEIEAEQGAELSDEQIDDYLNQPVPGGSIVRDWFSFPRGLQNVRNVVRIIVTADRAARGGEK